MSVDDLPLAYWVTVAGLFGLAFGSFATVAAYRWPRDQSLLRPPSHCTSCERRLTPGELVPVVSWALQRGRCRGCESRVSIRYPMVELASGGLAALAIAVFGPTWQGLAAAILGVALVPIVAIDLEHRLIPDVIVFPAAAAAVLVGIVADPSRWWVIIASTLGAAGFMLILWLVHPAGMGLGDVKLALLLGAVLGASVIPALAVAFLLGGLLGAALLLRFGPRARKLAVPFGPFLAVGALVALVWGPSMIGWYMGTFA